MKSYRIAIHVQHLQGSGHLVRALALGRALTQAGMRVRVMSGGKPTSHNTSAVDFVQLPSMHCTPGDFTDLRDEQGQAITDTWRKQRLNATLSALGDFQADALITELFPFGRRQLRFELLPVLTKLQEQAKSIPVICSVRDVLQRRKPARTEETVRVLNQFFTAVLVHGDERYLPLSNTFEGVADVKIPIVYTGYIHATSSSDTRTHHDPLAVHEQQASSGVVISAGSSVAGLNLMHCALAAKPLTQRSDQHWLIRVGNAVPEEQFEALAKRADALTTIERNQPNFLATLQDFAVSVSLSGYNTSLDILQARRPSVLVPFEGQGESEQLDRARALAQFAHIDVLREQDLSPTTLANAIDHVSNQLVSDFTLPDCAGLEGSVKTLQNLLNARNE